MVKPGSMPPDEGVPPFASMDRPEPIATSGPWH
jgi:hypothetical protein